MKIGFIGTGNMGSALAKAVFKTVGGENIYLSDHNENKLKSLSEELNANISDNGFIADNCDYIFLGVKPQVLMGMLSSIAENLEKREKKPVLVSMAAGVKIEKIEQALGDMPIIRIMPNMPVAIGEGMTLICSNKLVDDDKKTYFAELMNHSGKTDFIEEKLIDAASAVSGCGPAFCYMFLDSLADGGVECGLPKDKALLYALQTMIGSAAMVFKTNEHPSKLKDMVTSPGGSTIKGVHALEKGNLRGAAIDAVCEAYKKTVELGKD